MAVARRLLVGAVAAILTSGSSLTAVSSAEAAPVQVQPGPVGSKFSAAAEAEKLAAVKAPKLSWYTCLKGVQCAEVKVPLDYDKPKGAKVGLFVARVKARDQKRKIGTLFVNPGGPGGSAVDLTIAAKQVFSKKLLERFDIVGVDPRGVGYSTNVTCFSSTKAQQATLAGYSDSFPVTSGQEKAWLATDRKLGKACSKDALATSMSTAQVARDMELMRRAVKDSKLTYLGFSYGTYLGQVYANMFPTRFRAIVVDGVIDPVAWAGTGTSAKLPLELRLNAGAGAAKALREILVRCDKAGESRCAFATGNPVTNMATIAARLKAKPLVYRDDNTGELDTLTYPLLIRVLLQELYDPAGYGPVTDLLAEVYQLTDPAPAAARTARTGTARLSSEAVSVLQDAEQAGRPGWAPYNNSYDLAAAVICTDTRITARTSQYPAHARTMDQRAPYFGRLWLYNSSFCSGDAFPGDDEDAYTGPFTSKTKAPVLFVGNDYDPATNYAGAVSAAKRMPNSRLLRSNSFGHTAYGTSTCATTNIDTYLITGKLPKTGTVCVGKVQPFATGAAALRANTAREQALRQQHAVKLR